MSRHSVLNVVLAMIAVALVAAVVVLETDVFGTATPTSTTTTTTTLPSTTTTTTVAPTTTTTTTTTATTITTTTLPPTTVPPPERATVPVVVTSAGQSGERVGPVVYLLAVAGWTDIRGVNGAVPLAGTIVFFADGFQNAAELLATDLSLPATAVAPLVQAPPVAALGNATLLVYLGGS